jgi:galactoside O-acetyltransferase
VTKSLEPWGVYLGNKKIGERNKDEVLKNYTNFSKIMENERIGNLFQ